MMKRGTIVPERHRAGLPFEAALVFGCLGVIAQHRQQRVAFVAVQFLDVGGEAAIDVERPAPGFRVRANHRTLRAREHLTGSFVA